MAPPRKLVADQTGEDAPLFHVDGYRGVSYPFQKAGRREPGPHRDGVAATPGLFVRACQIKHLFFDGTHIVGSVGVVRRIVLNRAAAELRGHGCDDGNCAGKPQQTGVLSGAFDLGGWRCNCRKCGVSI